MLCLKQTARRKAGLFCGRVRPLALKLNAFKKKRAPFFGCPLVLKFNFAPCFWRLFVLRRALRRYCFTVLCFAPCFAPSLFRHFFAEFMLLRFYCFPFRRGFMPSRFRPHAPLRCCTLPQGPPCAHRPHSL